MILKFPCCYLYLGRGAVKHWGATKASEEVAPHIWIPQGKVSACALHVTQCL